MKLVSYRQGGRATVGVVVDAGVVDVRRRFVDVGDMTALLGASAGGLLRGLVDEAPDHALADVELLPVVPDPELIVCVGVNYGGHRAETSRNVDRGDDERPTLFLRTPRSQVGHGQPLVLPRISSDLDYEGEIAVVIGRSGRHIPADSAWDHVAGVSCYNDASVRDWQRHSSQWTAGKNFVGTGAFGPWLVTTDELSPERTMSLTTRVNGEVVQHASTDEMIFSIPELIEYVSAFTPLETGDVIVTGTPGGVGWKREPPRYLRAGDVVEVEVDAVGTLRNVVVDE